MKKYLVLSVFVLLTVSAIAVAQGKQWIHVRVAADGDEKFNLNLPLSLVDTLLPMVAEKELGRGHFRSHGVHWRGREWTIAELRELWEAVKSERGYDLATFEGKDSRLRLFLDDRYLRVESDDEDNDQVAARIPVSVVDALLSGDGEELNLMAAVDALKQLGSDELISVQANRGSVQVWIDGRSR